MARWSLSYPLIDESAESDAFAPRQAALVVPSGSFQTVADLPPSGIEAVGYWPQTSVNFGFDDGEKFIGGYGPTMLLATDYWTLRARSVELFETNMYARGLIRTLVTNEITTGLHLEATPEEKLLGLEEKSLGEWSEDVENRFRIWGSVPALCDQTEQCTFGALQAEARREALIAGDVLVVLRKDPATGLTRIQLISGTHVRSQLGQKPAKGNKIDNGVELDSMRRHVAYWVVQDDGTTKRLPAYGPKTGRRLAWLLYGTDKRLNKVRGKPLLSIILQSVKELDRYRDATLRKAVIQAMLAMFIQKDQPSISTMPMTSGAVRTGSTQLPHGNGEAIPRRFAIADVIPGMVMQELQVGEKPVAFPMAGADGFGAFEEALIEALAWTNEVPPEILKKSFSSNYSASKAAIQEFDMYLEKVRTAFGNDFCQPIYADWLTQSSVANKVDGAKFLKAKRDPSKYDEVAAWLCSDWSGQVKPSIDPYKQVNAFKEALAMGLITHDRAAREYNGSKWSKNVQRIAVENELLAKALAPMVALEASAKAPATPPPKKKVGKSKDDDEPTNDSEPDPDEDDQGDDEEG